MLIIIILAELETYTIYIFFLVLKTITQHFTTPLMNFKFFSFK